MMNPWADKDSKWWRCGLGTSPNLAQVYRPRPDLQAAQNDASERILLDIETALRQPMSGSATQGCKLAYKKMKEQSS